MSPEDIGIETYYIIYTRSYPSFKILSKQLIIIVISLLVPDSTPVEMFSSKPSFSLAANKLQGNIPPGLGKLQSLPNLDLSESNLKNIPVELFSSSSKLHKLNLSNNDLSG